MSKLVLVETPRDAFQGLSRLIPTAEKADFIAHLLDAGCRHVDFGSFVSPRAVPQMADSLEVWNAVRRPGVEFIAIIANERGLDRAIGAGGISTVGFPFSIADTFQRHNTNRGIDETWPVVARLVERCNQNNLGFILYLSMAFGNPDGDPWDLDRLLEFIERLSGVGVRIVSLADTIGTASAHKVRRVFDAAIKRFDLLELGAHFHSRYDGGSQNIQAAYTSGCRRFDSAVGGLGGCPFAQDALVGNIPTEKLVEWLEARGEATGINPLLLAQCGQTASQLAGRYGDLRRS